MFIVIIKEITKEKVPHKEYQKICNTGNERDGGAVFGYVDAPEKTVEREHTVYQQRFESLLVTEVVDTINHLSVPLY